MSQLKSPQWTHVALPSCDIDQSVAWYEKFTPLVLIERFEDRMGKSAWLGHAGQADPPFVLVLVMFFADQGKKQPQLAPFAHIGIEVPTEQALEAIAAQATRANCLAMPPQRLPAPVGYVCMIADPDGNRIEISHNQQVFQKVQEHWSGTRVTQRHDGPEAAVRAYIAALNRGNADEVAACVGDGFVNEHTSALGETIVGRAAYRERLGEFLASFPGLHYEVEQLIVDGQQVAVAYRMSASRPGSGVDDAGQRRLLIRGMFRFRVQDGRIVHRVDYWDSAEVTRQLGHA